MGCVPNPPVSRQLLPNPDDYSSQEEEEEEDGTVPSIPRAIFASTLAGSQPNDSTDNEPPVPLPVLVPNLEPVVHAILKKSVAVIASHAGFEAIDAQALEALADLSSAFLGRLCRLLKRNSEAFGQRSSSLEVLEEVLQQARAGGVGALSRYAAATAAAHQNPSAPPAKERGGNEPPPQTPTKAAQRRESDPEPPAMAATAPTPSREKPVSKDKKKYKKKKSYK
jgi:hypothetical protein